MINKPNKYIASTALAVILTWVSAAAMIPAVIPLPFPDIYKHVRLRGINTEDFPNVWSLKLIIDEETVVADGKFRGIDVHIVATSNNDFELEANDKNVKALILDFKKGRSLAKHRLSQEEKEYLSFVLERIFDIFDG